MSNVPPGVGGFFGKADKRSEGWYWVDASTKEPKGPFETKGQGDRERSPMSDHC
jgi:hypothetical protein